MSVPETLSRPIAARVANLPEPVDHDDNPEVAPAVIDAAIEALRAGKTHYTDRPGILPLRTRITDDLKERFELELSPDEVTITCGATEARFVALKQLTKAGTKIFAPIDATPISDAAKLLGIEVISAETQTGAALSLTHANISVLYLQSSETFGGMQTILEAALKLGWWVIWDVSDGAATRFHPAQIADLAPQVVTIGSLSDALPGWRVGWMAGSKLANKLRAYKQSMTICTTSISQWAGLGLVK